MRRSRSVCLVLLAGGVAISLAGGCESRQAQLQRECAEARAEMRPDAEQICSRSVSRSYSSSGGSHGWWLFGRSGGNSATRTAFSSSRSSAAATSSRGGFGATASSHGGASS